MPSSRKQINIRATEEDLELVEALTGRVHARLGLRPSQSDLFRLALAALAREYLVQQAPPAEPKPKKRRKT